MAHQVQLFVPAVIRVLSLQQLEQLAALTVCLELLPEHLVSHRVVVVPPEILQEVLLRQPALAVKQASSLEQMVLVPVQIAQRVGFRHRLVQAFVQPVWLELLPALLAQVAVQAAQQANLQQQQLNQFVRIVVSAHLQVQQVQVSVQTVRQALLQARPVRQFARFVRQESSQAQLAQVFVLHVQRGLLRVRQAQLSARHVVRVQRLKLLAQPVVNNVS